MSQASSSLTTAPVSNAASTAPAKPPRHAALELLARYRAILGAAWAVRHELAGPKRLADEAAFLPAALALQDTPVHPAPRRLAWALIALAAIALAWSLIGQLDIVAVASGRVVVSERTKLIQPLERSVVQRILVKDGDTVQAGQPLVALDATIASADKASMAEQRKASESEALRARALLQRLFAMAVSSPQTLSNSERAATAPRAPEPEKTPNPLAAGFTPPPHWSTAERTAAQAQLQAEWSDIAAKLAKLAAEARRREAEIATVREAIVKLETTLPLSRRREDDLKGLAQDGFVPAHLQQDRTRERIELERDLAAQQSRLLEAQAALHESRQSAAAYLAETRRSLHEREAQADLKRQQATQEQAKATQREKLTTLTAPVAGTVQQLAVHTAGGVVTEAQTLMVIVPREAQVTAEVVLENKDIGFVHVGDEVEIKLETFPYTRYGTIAATVSRVTADAVQDEKRGAVFPVTLALNAHGIDVDGKRIALSPGMNLTAEIKTGKRRVIEYLLSPVQRATSESLRER